jgi:hypothetical protein
MVKCHSNMLGVLAIHMVLEVLNAPGIVTKQGCLSNRNVKFFQKTL